MTKKLAIAVIVLDLFSFGYWAGSNTAIECGSCGAHVCEWWTIDNIHTGEPVDVCEVCYQTATS